MRAIEQMRSDHNEILEALQGLGVEVLEGEAWAFPERLH